MLYGGCRSVATSTSRNPIALRVGTQGYFVGFSKPTSTIGIRGILQSIVLAIIVII